MIWVFKLEPGSDRPHPSFKELALDRFSCSMDHLQIWVLNFLTANDKLYRLLITFTNSLEPDQAGHAVCADLDPNNLTISDRSPERS